MTDLISGRVDLGDVAGAVACGGFSFGDVLGAGRGWAATFRYNARARDAIQRLVDRSGTFVLGVCNGCQMIADLAPELVPATSDTWPRFVANRSERFESRVVMLAIEASPSLFFAGMAGSWMPIATAHGEGRAELPPSIGWPRSRASASWPRDSATHAVTRPKRIRRTRTARRAASRR